MMVARESDLPLDQIPTGMSKQKEIGTCEFGCGERVIYRRDNYREQRSKGLQPVLICTTCYNQGRHIQQGYRT